MTVFLPTVVKLLLVLQTVVLLNNLSRYQIGLFIDIKSKNAVGYRIWIYFKLADPTHCNGHY